ncbi:hypothetical protein ACPA9J_19090 [Pseudomonas aeruginosa]
MKVPPGFVEKGSTLNGFIPQLLFRPRQPRHPVPPRPARMGPGPDAVVPAPAIPTRR